MFEEKNCDELKEIITDQGNGLLTIRTSSIT